MRLAIAGIFFREKHFAGGVLLFTLRKRLFCTLSWCTITMPPDTETRTQSGVTSREGQHHSPKLLESLCQALNVRHYSNRTADTYCSWVKHFVHFHNLRHPKEMGEIEINAFLTHLAVEEKVSSSTFHHDQYACVEFRSIWCAQLSWRAVSSVFMPIRIRSRNKKQCKV